MNRTYLQSTLLILLFGLFYGRANSQIINITQTGAKGDGKSMNTVAIQKAVNEIAKLGGGKVIVSQGIYLTGTIFLKSNVTLHIEAGATILGSSNIADY